MKKIYNKFYIITLLTIGSTMYADSNTPYIITLVNNSDSNGVNTKFLTKNTHDNHPKVESITVVKSGSNTNVSLTRDLRKLICNNFNNGSKLPHININDNSNGTQKYRRGAQVFIYGGIIPNSSDTTSYPQTVVVCPSGTIQSTNYTLSPTDSNLATCSQYTNENN